ncbi:hypothetical protein KIN20_027791 [Parelaphostrongylus tenuis]|uniref:Uncharacterized protein n=1 Tax=Parelaphostrongylus tenuis TaxID=148309 RepID=A0AAD5R022_PARTN|nr:hypothetical protein KIN20_027791 [Parelaphostrongylus tenuis]
MQAECYECFLADDFLKKNVELYNENSVETSLGQHKLKDGSIVTRVTRRKNGGDIADNMKFHAKPDPEYEQTKEKIREEIIMSADKAVERKHELMKANEEVDEEVTDEEEEDEESKEGESETKSSTPSGSTTVESERFIADDLSEAVTSNWTKRLWSPSAHQLSTDAIIATSTEPKRASELPPLTATHPKPTITSIKSIDFDIPQLDKSPSSQSSSTPRNSPSPPAEHNTPPKDVDELSDIESIAGIDQLLESGRSDSISF